MKIGIFGGTFNPPHKAHLDIARLAKFQLGLDQLVVMPCGLPPHKRCDVDSSTRFALCKAAFWEFEVSDFEITKKGTSYTVETLRYIHGRYPKAELYLVIGGDSLANFANWYCPQEIASLATLVVADRAGVAHTPAPFGAKTVYLNLKPSAFSSTDIRLRYQFGFDNLDYVPRAVEEYVLKNNLYAQYRDIALRLRNYLSESRLWHTFYVVKRGLELAYDEERHKVFLACLLHDCAKYVPPSCYEHYGFVPPADMPEPVVHSFLGEHVARQDFGITDMDVLSAIAYHTTGCPDMTRLQKIVYVADKTEQTRPYPLEHLLRGTLDDMLRACLAEANSYTVAHHGTDKYPLTQQTLAYYLRPKTTKK